MSQPFITRLQNWLRPASNRLYPVMRDGDAVELTELLAAGADPELRSPEGQTPLMYAVALDRLDMVEILLQAGADPLGRDVTGRTALDTAIRLSSSAIIQRLVESAPVLRRDGAITAVSLGRRDIYPILMPDGRMERDAYRESAKRSIAKALSGFLAMGHSPEDRDENGTTPLLLVCRTGDITSARVLLEAGAGVDTADHRGVTPLLQAIHWNHSMLAGFLLEAGADPGKPDHNNTTPLMSASARGQRELIHMLKVRLGNHRPEASPFSHHEATEKEQNHCGEDVMSERIRRRQAEKERHREPNRKQSRNTPPQIFSTPSQREAFAVLGLNNHASPAAIKQAYYNQMRQFHPDRFMNQPERVRMEAERRAKEINAAYESLRRAS